MPYRKGQWVALFLLAGSVCTGTASAAVFPDATGEVFSGTPHLDFSSVEVTNDATDIRFAINLAGNPIETNWGKYLIGIDSLSGGDTRVNGNGWGRPIQMSSGMDYFIGSWADGDGGGAEVYRFVGPDWARERSSNDGNLSKPTITTSSTTLTIPLAALGLEPGDTFAFDVYSAGGGGNDSANDASSNPSQSTSDWPGPYNSGGTVSTYQVVVPEPASLGLIGLGAATLLIRRRR